MTALDLGGTLFLPATHKHLLAIVTREKYPNLKSVLIDTEDSLDDLEAGLACIREMLGLLVKTDLLILIRPRNVKVLEEILLYAGIEKVNGFILPKFSLENATSYLEGLKKSDYVFMPSIEGNELFEQKKLIELREILIPFKKQIPLLRFGLEDMLRQLKMKRTCEDSLFDYAVASSVIGNFIAVFKSVGFDVSGGVYPCFENKEGFQKDVQRDMKEGLISKTIIHPNQIELINELYKVDEQEYQEALEICNALASVFNQNGKMAEKNTMKNYSEYILKRAKIYGTR